MKVKVKDSIQDNFVGFIDHIRRRPGDVFTLNEKDGRRALFPGEKALVEKNDDAKADYDRIKDKDGNVPQLYSFKWMEPVGEAVPDRVTTGPVALKQKIDDLKLEKAAAKQADAPVGGSNSDVI